MKKYLFGFVAIVFGLGLVAFTNPDLKKRATQDFFYTAPGGSYSEADVENNSNWSTTVTTCTFGNSKACKFTVDVTYTKLVNGQRVLRTAADGSPFITIIAESINTITFRVSWSTPFVTNIVHKN